MGTQVFGAVDLGASGGRVVAGLVDGDDLTLDVVHRFSNGVVERDGNVRLDGSNTPISSFWRRTVKRATRSR